VEVETPAMTRILTVLAIIIIVTAATLSLAGRQPPVASAVMPLTAAAQGIPATLVDGTDLGAALQRARADKTVVLLNFTGSDWCHWCIVLKAEVLGTPEFSSWLATRGALVDVDFPRDTPQDPATVQRHQRLSELFGIEGFPTIVMVDGDGRERARLGYQKGGAAAWTTAADGLLGPR